MLKFYPPFSLSLVPEVLAMSLPPSSSRPAQQFVANFVRFMDFLNHIKRAPQMPAVRGGVAASVFAPVSFIK